MNTRPLLLDTFCKAGGASMGYYQAGFDVVGVDIEPQPHYPFRFILADALEYIADHGKKYDVIHASPVCKGYSSMSNCLMGYSYPKQIADVRQVLLETQKPYIIENVTGAKRALLHPVMLCGNMFDLKVYRHRWFETEPFVLTPSHSPHRDQTPKAGRGKSPKGFISVAGHMTDTKYCAWAMGIDWMNGNELAQAIPPAFTKFFGLLFIQYLRRNNL